MFVCKSKIEKIVVLLNSMFWRENLHTNTKHELLHVLSGHMTIECADGRKFPLQIGDILLIPANWEHRDIFNLDSELKLQLILFSLENSEEFFAAVRPEKLKGISAETRNEIKYLLSHIRNDLNTSTTDMLVNDCRLNTILQLICRELFDRSDAAGSDAVKVSPLHRGFVRNPARLGAAAKHYVECNFNKPISLTTVARHFKVSNCYLSHLFRQENGESFITFLTDLRLQEAERLLRDSSMNIAEIARNVGYENANYFARIFQKKHGFPPSDFREKTLTEARRQK